MATSGSSLSQEVLDKLPKQSFFESLDLYEWEGFWYRSKILEGMLAFRSHFEERSDDVFLASSMKTGTTWLKALCICIMGCQSKATYDHGGDEDALELKNPHEYILSLEYFYTISISKNAANDYLPGMPSPRLFHTHLPYSALPDSIKNSECKIVYIARNPKDTLVSMWHFYNKIIIPNQEPYPFEKAYDDFCRGVHLFGPFFDHVLQYWFESLKIPDKVLFLKYEELKRDPKEQVKRLASFLGRPFANEDEVDKVLWRSSLDRLRNLEVNKTGLFFHTNIPNSSFFRLGVVGDWKNYFTDEMEQGLDEITKMKLEGSGLVL